MKIRAKNGEQTVDITLPATDMDIQYCMKCIGIEDIVPVCCISAVSYTHLMLDHKMLWFEGKNWSKK